MKIRKSVVRLSLVSILFALTADADILPGLEAYGDLSLVDEVDCATDTTHEFHEHASNASSVQTILGSECRVLPHPSDEAGFFSYRLGKEKGLVAHDMYLLVVEYPEDVPRTATLINRAMNSRNGFHTGISVGETMVAHIIGQTHPESMNVPLSGAYNRLEQVMFLNENVFPYNTTDSYIDSESEGFDVIIHVFSAADSPDSAGAAVRAIRLYRMNDEKGLATPVNYPVGDAPKRHVTWRDEMGKHNAYSSNADRYDNFRMKMRLMKELGIDTWSRDMLEFGYNQYWDVSYANNGNSNWMYANSDYWTTEIDIYADAGIYLLPFYEYAGSRGPGGLGVNSGRKAVQMFRGGYGGHYNLFVANANGASGANVDITDDAAYTDFAAILDCTILRYKDRANFLGAWIRNRGSMPVSFSENARNRFCADTGRASGSVSIDDLSNVSEYGDEAYRYICQMMYKPALYQEYRTWWNGKRAQWLKAMQQHLADGGLAGAKVYFSGVWGEAGWELQNLAYYRDYFNCVAAEDADAWKALSGSTAKTCGIDEMSWNYTHYGIDNDSFTWFPDEYNHAAPRNDPETYTNVSDVAICYPYHGVHTTIPASAATYRNASGDLFFSRHFCLYEGCGNGVGYFTTEMDRCGRAIMLPELYALAYQDPTLIGFMQGGHLARNCTKEFRDFNEHFLSLPAVKGTVLWGGGWGIKPYTVRKYKTADATYYAIVNTSSQSFDNSQKYLSDESGTFTLYDTVTGETTTLGGGYACFTLEPYQLKVYSTAAPDTPRFFVAVPSIGSTTASVPLAVTTLGGSSATLRAYISPNADMSGATELPVSTLTAAGTNAVSFTGLVPNTTYYATFGLTNALSKGAAHVLSFTTDIPSEGPRGTATVSADVNTATFSVNLSALGDGAASCDLYAVFTPSDSGLATRSGNVGTRTSTGECSFTFAPLSSSANYSVELFATNNLNHGTRLCVAAVTTLAKPAAEFGAGAWAEGLVQAKVSTGVKTSMNKTFDILAAADATRVPGVAMAAVTANATTYATQCYENPYDGQKFYYSQYDTTFGYAGEMFFEFGKTYAIGKSYDDGVLVKIDGMDILDNQQYNATTTKTYTPTSTGWKPIEIRLWDGDGGKGPKNGWTNFTGVAWNTNGFTTISADTTGNWTPFMVDAGTPLRCRSSVPSFVHIGQIVRGGTSIVVPVSIDSYDEDNVVTVYATTSAPAAGEFTSASSMAHDFSGWASAVGTAPAIGIDQLQNIAVSGLPLAPGTEVYVVARLANARTGYDVVSPMAIYTVPSDQTVPEFTVSLADVGYRDAAFAIAVASIGDGAASLDVVVTVGTGVYSAASGVSGYNDTFRTPSELDYGTDYTATITVSNNLGKSTSKTVDFVTKQCPIALGEPIGVCSGIGTNATATVEVMLADIAATLALKVDGLVVKTWANVAAGTGYSASFPISVGQTKAYVFVLSAAGCADVEQAGEITGRKIVDWFSVPLDGDYASWVLATGPDPHDTTAGWTVSGMNNASALSTGAGGELILLTSTGSDGAVAYEPSSPSEGGRTLEVGGTAMLRAHPSVPPEPDVPPLAGLAVGTVDGTTVLYGYGTSGWTVLSGGEVTTNTPVAWKATLDFGMGTVAYALGSVAFSPKTALPLGATQVERVVFLGNGEFGAFRGVYAESGWELYAASIRADGTGLSFTTEGTSDKFVIGIAETVGGRYYAAFAADSLDTPRDEWVCVGCEQSVGDNSPVDLPCGTTDSEGHQVPSRFFMIFGMDRHIDLGVAFGSVSPSSN